MDKILEGILKSNHPERFKQQLINKVVISTADKPLCKVSYFALLKMSFEMSLYGTEEFIRTIGTKVYLTYAKNNQSSQEFCSEIINSFTDVRHVEDSRNWIKILNETLEQTKGYESHDELSAKTVQFVSNIVEKCQDNLEATTALIVLLKQLGVTPSFEQCKDFYRILLEAVSHFVPASQDPSVLTSFVSDITTICSCFKQLWSSNNEAVLKQSLSMIYDLLCSQNETGVAFAAVAQVFPVNKLHLTNVLMEEGVINLDNDQLAKVMAVMIGWLSWPISTNIHMWVLHSLRELAKAKKFALICKIGEDNIQQITDRMFVPVARNGVFAVLSYLLLSIQQTHIPFHKALKCFPDLTTQLKSDPVLMDKYVELIHVLFHIHSGFPDLYEPILQLISDYPVPTSGRIEKIVAEHKWDSKRSRQLDESLNVSHVGESRSCSGYVGLENLANICYMNSIIQALFMTNQFVKSVMRSEYGMNTFVGSLQHLFSFLIHSNRKCFAPSNFLQVCKPPWFERGQQQDCSEFLRYLLDVLHEQTKNVENGEKLVEQSFFGKSETSYKCSTCNTVSKKSDDFVDIGLNFSEQILKSSTVNRFSSRLKDQASSAESNNKDVHLNDLLDHYFLPETLNGDNQYFCDKCKSLQDATRSVQITKAPNHLILNLLRFSYNLKSKSRSKICVNVEYPKVLIIKSNSGSETVENVYSLYGVVVHSGLTSDCGHYYAYARRLENKCVDDANGLCDLYVDDWYLFNDSNVSKSSFESCGNVTKRFSTDTAYVLFYELVEMHGKCTYKDVKNLQLPSHLSKMLRVDNSALIKEEEQEKECEKKKSKNSIFTSRMPSWGDFDDDQGGNGSGSCGQGNVDLSVSRFVF